EAVSTGIMMGFVDAVRGMLLRVIDELGCQPVVIVTGGWAELLADKIALIGHHAPHLVLRGVARIVELNAEQASG
ncbi:MAG: type III pantothenate kinase, partial [Rhodothermales bacterium]|nr:type III pantothenate kinase [Rhodothermales bacterium]